jgi:hypothetical protein
LVSDDDEEGEEDEDEDDVSSFLWTTDHVNISPACS